MAASSRRASRVSAFGSVSRHEDTKKHEDTKTMKRGRAERRPGPFSRFGGLMAQKPSEMTNDEIKGLMRAIAIANGRPLSEERIEADLPAYKNFLLAIERI